MLETEILNEGANGPDLCALVGTLTLGEVLRRILNGKTPDDVAVEVGLSRNTLRAKLDALDVAWDVEQTFKRRLIVKSTGEPLVYSGGGVEAEAHGV